MSDEPMSKNAKRRAVRALRGEHKRLVDLLGSFLDVERHIASTDSVRQAAALEHVKGYADAVRIDLARVVEVGERLAAELGKHFRWREGLSGEDTKIEDPDDVVMCLNCEEQGPSRKAFDLHSARAFGDAWVCRRCANQNPVAAQLEGPTPP